MTAYTLAYFDGKIAWEIVAITLGTTFIMYNTQQLLLGFLILNGRDEQRKWLKEKSIVLSLMVIAGLTEIYPLLQTKKEFLFTYVTAAIISFLYFLPFSNLRSVPLVKSIIIGLVWSLVCVIAPLGISQPDNAKINFGLSQFLFITALCILFNIRDVEQDRINNTFTLPVLYGTRTAKIFAMLFLAGYLACAICVDISRKFMFVHITTFLLSCIFTIRSSPQKHSFYYLIGVDGLILIQALIGLLVLHL